MAINPAIAVALIVPPAIIAITLHEAAHGFVAHKLGDDTALLSGRLTLNPLKHIDLVGTILLPAALLLLNTGFIFGYAKPVPVNSNALFHPRRDMVWVAIAGPAMNFALAFVSFLFAFLAAFTSHSIARWLVPIFLNSIIVNIILATLNIIPLPPLDGGKIAIGLLPRRFANPLAKMDRVGLLIVVAVFLILPVLGRKMGLDLNLADLFVGTPLHYMMKLVHLAIPFR